MKLENHVFAAIESLERGKTEEAMMHATFSIDGTARNTNNSLSAGAELFKSCLRKYYWLIERFMAAGINLEETVWSNIKLQNGFGKVISNPDFADIIYHVFRCNHAHAREVPFEFELLPVKNNNVFWIIGIQDGRVRMPETIIYGLLAVSVFAKENAKIHTCSDHFLTWQSPGQTFDRYKFVIKNSWGKELELNNIFLKYPITRIKLNL